MSAKLKVLGVLLVAMGVLGAVAAPALAQQQGSLTTDGESLTLDLTEITEGPESNGFTIFGNTVECPGTVYVGHKYNTTPHEPILNGSGTLTLSPAYASCNVVAGESEFPMTIEMNGCDYVLHIGQTEPRSNEEGTYGNGLDLTCPEGEAMEMITFLGEGHGVIVCVTTVEPQNGLAGAHITNTPASKSWPVDSLGLTGSYEGLSATNSGLCGAEEEKAGQIHVDLTVEGTNPAGEATGITVTD